MRKKKVSETTLKIYRYMVLWGKPLGVRELQRKMKMSSPSLVLYHLNKLEKMGLVIKDINGKYVVNKRTIDFSFLKDLVMLGYMCIPRYVFYATFITSLLVAYILLKPNIIDNTYLLGLLMGFSSSFILWYETLRKYVVE